MSQRALLFLIAATLATGCGAPKQEPDASVQVPVDAGAEDAGLADAGVVDAGVDDAGLPDAGLSDAGLEDAGMEASCALPGADFVERADRTNDIRFGGQMPETTNLVLGTAPRTINGCSDPRYQALNSGDRDTYRLAVTSPSVLVGSATRTGFADAFPVGFKVRIYLDDGPRLLGEGSGDRITFGPIALPAGSYALEIYDDVWVDSTYAYRISLQTLACPATNARTYTEAQDTASHRGNDVFQFDLNGFVFSETAASDVAEPSAGLALAPGEAIAIQGHSADVAPAGDSFRDRDTFQLAPSASVDLILLESAVTPATPPLLNANLWIQIVLNGTDARSTVTSAYWIFGAATKVWVGNLDSFTALSTDYTVRVCAFAVP